MKLLSVKPKEETSILIAITISLMACLATTFVGAVIAATLIYNEVITQTESQAISYIIHFLSALVGSFTVCMIVKKKLLVVSVISATAYIVTLIAVTASFLGGQYSNVLKTVITVISGSATSVAILLLIKKRKQNRVRKYAYR